MKCTCGTQIAMQVNFCPNCGASVERINKAVQTQVPASANDFPVVNELVANADMTNVSERRRGWKPMLILNGIYVLILLTVFFLFYFRIHG